MFLSVFVTVIVMLPLCILGVLDELVCVTYEVTESQGRSDGAKATVLLSLVSNFSKTAVSQTLHRHMYSAGGFVAEAGGA